MKEEEPEPTTRLVEPYSIERRMPHWYVHTFDRTSEAERSFRLDRMRTANLMKERFEPRPEFEPQRFRDARTARILYSKQVARWEVEKGAVPLRDGSALGETPVGSEDWLVGEIFFHRGEAVLL